MLVVIEGCDKVGKSTLAKRIAKGLECPIMHFSKPPEDAYGYFEYALELPTVCPLVVDRWVSGDRTYAEAMGHETRLTEEQKEELLTVAAERGTMFLFCWDNPEAVAHRFKTDGEDFTPVDRIGRIQALFHEEAVRLAARGDVTVVRLNNFLSTYEVLSYGKDQYAWRDLQRHLPQLTEQGS